VNPAQVLAQKVDFALRLKAADGRKLMDAIALVTRVYTAEGPELAPRKLETLLQDLRKAAHA
jgi:hypothetical protein